MDAFLGRTQYSSYLGTDALNLRKWLPFNVRAFVISIDRYYNVPDYVLNSRDQRLIGVLSGIVESYSGERGFMGNHRCTLLFLPKLTIDKVYGFLEISAKTGRSETNGGTGGGEEKPWDKIHDTLADSMMERLSRYGTISNNPHDIRGSFQECSIKARITSRQRIDRDQCRRTADVTIEFAGSGVTFNPGDRVVIMPQNGQADIAKVVSALSLSGSLEEEVPAHGAWTMYSQHMNNVYSGWGTLSVSELLRVGKLAPLTRDVVVKVTPVCIRFDKPGRFTVGFEAHHRL
jgi:hypothetical protein